MELSNSFCVVRVTQKFWIWRLLRFAMKLFISSRKKKEHKWQIYSIKNTQYPMQTLCERAGDDVICSQSGLHALYVTNLVPNLYDFTTRVLIFDLWGMFKIRFWGVRVMFSWGKPSRMVIRKCWTIIKCEKFTQFPELGPWSSRRNFKRMYVSCNWEEFERAHIFIKDATK